MTERSALLKAVANNLSGKPVVLCFVEPYATSVSGCAYIRDGQAHIEIRPGFDDKKLLYVLCHEAAHLRSGDVPDISGWTREALNKHASLSLKVSAALPRELEADKLAYEWVSYAEYFRWSWPGMSWLDSRLKALAGWWPGDRRHLKYSGGST